MFFMQPRYVLFTVDDSKEEAMAEFPTTGITIGNL